MHVKYIVVVNNSFSTSRNFCIVVAQGKPYNIDEYVSVISTPGHTGSDVSVVVQNTEQYGTVVVAGMNADS